MCCLDDDSISSTRTSSTVGYRDSFGDNDDGCFHLLERYDDSGAVARLLQSRRSHARMEQGRSRQQQIMGREALLLEEDTSTADTESSQQSRRNYVILEHRDDEDTLI